jgi:hypothetical protein
MNHKEILDLAKRYAKNPEDIPKVETLHQNIAHMTIALKEVETRLYRVVNKMKRLNIEYDFNDFVIPLVNCVFTLKKEIENSKEKLNKL